MILSEVNCKEASDTLVVCIGIKHEKEEKKKTKG